MPSLRFELWAKDEVGPTSPEERRSRGNRGSGGPTSTRAPSRRGRMRVGENGICSRKYRQIFIHNTKLGPEPKIRPLRFRPSSANVVGKVSPKVDGHATTNHHRATSTARGRSTDGAILSAVEDPAGVRTRENEVRRPCGYGTEPWPRWLCATWVAGMVPFWPSAKPPTRALNI